MNALVGTEKSHVHRPGAHALPGSVANPAFDYVALGHIHKGQILGEYPPAVYPGSFYRLDFGDENDAKGFYLIEIQPGSAGAKKKSQF